MLFLLKLSSYLITQINRHTHGSKRAKFSLGTIAVATLFSNIGKRNDGFGQFGGIGSYHGRIQDYFLQLLGENIEKHVFELSLALEGIHNSPLHNIDTGDYTDNLRPFGRKEECPNVFSIFHLVYQSIKHDCVLPFSTHSHSLTISRL